MIFRQTPDSTRHQLERGRAKAGNIEAMNMLAMIYEQGMAWKRMTKQKNYGAYMPRWKRRTG